MNVNMGKEKKRHGISFQMKKINLMLLAGTIILLILTVIAETRDVSMKTSYPEAIKDRQGFGITIDENNNLIGENIRTPVTREKASVCSEQSLDMFKDCYKWPWNTYDSCRVKSDAHFKECVEWLGR